MGAETSSASAPEVGAPPADEGLVASLADGLVALDMFEEPTPPADTAAVDSSGSDDEETPTEKEGVCDTTTPAPGTLQASVGDASITLTQSMMGRWASEAAAIPDDVDAAYPTNTDTENVAAADAPTNPLQVPAQDVSEVRVL